MTTKILAAATAAALAGGLILATTGPAQPVSALTADQATDAYTSFLDTYWDAERQYFRTYSDGVVHPEHAHGPEGGLYSDYWWEAQLWEMVMDRYERAGGAPSREMVDAVWDGFRAAYPVLDENDFNDDIGWWARGAIRAHELTGEQRYLDAAREMFDVIARYEDDAYGGGIWWKNVDIGDGDANQKNVATNGTAIQTAAMLYEATGEERYLETAKRLFAWLDSTLHADDGRLDDSVSGDPASPRVDDRVFSYNQGGYAGAAHALHRATGEQHYLEKATTSVDWSLANLTRDGVLVGEGKDDGGGFRAVLTRILREMADDSGQSQYEEVLSRNASQAVDSVNSLGIGGYDWSTPTPDPSVEAIQSLAAGATAAVAQHAAPE